MAVSTQTKPVEDTVSKINNELAVGSDLEFQQRWWKFERAVWIVFALIIVMDLLGCFGRGPLANARIRTPDGAMDVKYERIERFRTPSILTIEFGPSAVRNGKVQLWVSDTLVKGLGNQRVVPQPESTVLAGSGLLYTFPTAPHPNSAEFALEPGSAGLHELTLRIPGGPEINTKIFVMP